MELSLVSCLLSRGDFENFLLTAAAAVADRSQTATQTREQPMFDRLTATAVRRTLLDLSFGQLTNRVLVVNNVFVGNFAFFLVPLAETK